MTSSSGVLCQLLQHSQTLKQVEYIFRQSLPPPLNQHCYVGNLRERTLVVYTDSSLWATRLRYLMPELLHLWQLERAFPSVDKVEIKVRPSSNNTPPLKEINTLISR